MILLGEMCAYVLLWIITRYLDIRGSDTEEANAAGAEASEADGESKGDEEVADGDENSQLLDGKETQSESKSEEEQTSSIEGSVEKDKTFLSALSSLTLYLTDFTLIVGCTHILWVARLR